MLRDAISRVRRNHALEHATVSVLLAGDMRPPLGGYSTTGGFFVIGSTTLEDVSEAAGEALSRLKDGERELAVSPFCGTNLATAALLAGAVATLVMGRSDKRLQRLPTAGMAIVAATMLARPIGNALQRRYTTLSDAREVEINGVRRVWAGPLTVHRVSTRMGRSQA